MWVDDQAFHSPPLASLWRQQCSHLLASGLEYSADRIFQTDGKSCKIISCYDAIHYFKGRWIKSNLRCCLRQVRNKVKCMGIFCRWNSKRTFGSQEAIYYHQPHKKSIYNSSFFIQCISNKFIWVLQQHLRPKFYRNDRN